ncbi:UNVERIFIED_CONTAM: hypothetical protein Sangu_3202900 [Sesamum angustifolium]|uniref:DUF4283 domain-containing protein n=1 Tax=Sesamum angustifolium TaxID=2727405 RepID=A0AAW2JL48_9LAMI
MSSGFYFFQFKTRTAMEEIIEGGPWLFQGQPIVLQCWEPGMSLRRQKHKQIPVWIRLKHLPMEYWTEEGLSIVASGVGTPLYSDKITRNCSRLDFARICVMLDYNSTLPKHLVVISPQLRDGKEVPTRVDIEYEWLPQICKHCCSLGHSVTACPDIKKKDYNPPVTVFVKKQQVDNKDVREADNKAELAGAKSTLGKEIKSQHHPLPPNPQIMQDDHLEKGITTSTDHGDHDIVLYNPFGILGVEHSNTEMHTETEPTGPNICSPVLGDP